MSENAIISREKKEEIERCWNERIKERLEKLSLKTFSKLTLSEFLEILEFMKDPNAEENEENIGRSVRIETFLNSLS